MIDINIDDIDREIRQRNAWEYCQYMLPEFYENRQFLRIVADIFQYLIDQENCDQFIINRIKSSPYVEKFILNPEEILIALPPRAGKSVTVSLCCSWALGNYPEESILRTTHSKRLFNKFSRDIRTFIKSPDFIDIFPGVELSEDNQDVAGWSLKQSKQGAFFGAGVNGDIVGFGASKLAITDDLYKSHDAAMSETQNESTCNYMESAFDSRKEKECRQLDIGTRWSKKDYIGRKMENGIYDIVVRVPALDENEQSFCSDVLTTKQYLEKRRKLHNTGKEYIWESEYMQEPIEIKGILFPRIKMKRFRMKDLNIGNLVGKVCFVDSADMGKDFYSAPLGYIFPNGDKYDVFITKVLYTKDPNKITQPLQIAMINNEEINFTFIETNKEGTVLVNNIKKETEPYKVKGILAKGNKETRILMEAEYILDFHFLEDEEQDEMYSTYFDDFTSYLKEGGNYTDDAADSTAGLSKAIRSIYKQLLN